MCIFTHIAAGALVGAISQSPYLAPVLGLGSHILLDVVPHYDFEDMRVEILFAVLVTAAIAIGGAFNLAILLGVVFALLPDLENLLWRLNKIKDEQKVFPGHRGIIPHGKVAGQLNLIPQFIFSGFVVFYLIRRAQ